MMARTGCYERKTGETSIKAVIKIEGQGQLVVDTGFGFFDHMLAQLSFHSLMDITIEAQADIKTGYHHLCEDVGICLGRALGLAVSGQQADKLDSRGAAIRRFGWALAPMDGSLAQVGLDVSGRGGAYINAPCMDEDLIEFLKAFAKEAGITLHIDVLKSDNHHHSTEAAFKGLAIALRAALEPDLQRTGASSSKGCIG